MNSKTSDFPQDPHEIKLQFEDLKLKLSLLERQIQKTGEAGFALNQGQEEPFKELQTAFLDHPAPASETEPPHSVSSAHLKDHRPVREIKEIEKFRLGVWIAKMAVITMMFMTLSITVLFIYTAYATKKLPDLSLLATIFGHLKEVIIVIIDSEK
jgi:hypothetical protein